MVSENVANASLETHRLEMTMERGKVRTTEIPKQEFDDLLALVVARSNPAYLSKDLMETLEHYMEHKHEKRESN